MGVLGAKSVPNASRQRSRFFFRGRRGLGDDCIVELQLDGLLSLGGIGAVLGPWFLTLLLEMAEMRWMGYLTCESQLACPRIHKVNHRLVLFACGGGGEEEGHGLKRLGQGPLEPR